MDVVDITSSLMERTMLQAKQIHEIAGRAVDRTDEDDLTRLEQGKEFAEQSKRIERLEAMVKHLHESAEANTSNLRLTLGYGMVSMCMPTHTHAKRRPCMFANSSNNVKSEFTHNRLPVSICSMLNVALLYYCVICACGVVAAVAVAAVAAVGGFHQQRRTRHCRQICNVRKPEPSS